MAIEFSYDGEKINVEGGALEISKDTSGLKVKFNRTPKSAWSQAGRRGSINSEFGVTVADVGGWESGHTYSEGKLSIPKQHPWLLPGKRNLADWELDPHYYKSPNSRGMTVLQSTNRAAQELYSKQWQAMTYMQKGSFDTLKKVVRAMIVNGAGRDMVYNLGARTKDRYSISIPPAFRPNLTAPEMLNRLAYTEGYLAAPVELQA